MWREDQPIRKLMFQKTGGMWWYWGSAAAKNWNS